MATRCSDRFPIAIQFFRVAALIVSLFLTSPHTLQAQPPEPGQIAAEAAVPPAPAELILEVSPENPITIAPFSPTVVAAPTTVCDTGYWIVNSRHCTAQVEAGQACNFEVFRFDGVNPGCCSSMSDMWTSLQPGVPVCFMIHGSFVTYESMLTDCAGTNRWLRQSAPCKPLHLIFLSWDSDDGDVLQHLRVNKYGRRAALNGLYLADLVSQVSLDHPICLMGHSHGSRVVAAALHAMAGGCVEGRVLTSGPHPIRRIRVVMAAAALDRNWLDPGSLYDRALCHPEAVINLRNRADLALQFYPLRRPFGPQAIGTAGLRRRAAMVFGDGHSKFVDLGITTVVGPGHIWMHYYRQPRIAEAIRHYVYFDE